MVTQDINLTAAQLNMLLIAYQFIPGTKKNLPMQTVREIFSVTREEDPVLVCKQLMNKRPALLDINDEGEIAITKHGRSRVQASLQLNVPKYLRQLKRVNPVKYKTIIEEAYEQTSATTEGQVAPPENGQRPTRNDGDGRQKHKEGADVENKTNVSIPESEGSSQQNTPTIMAGISSTDTKLPTIPSRNSDIEATNTISIRSAGG